MSETINGVTIKAVDTEWDVYFDMALTMLEEIIRNNHAGKDTVMIVPVGPTQQYPLLAEMVNRLGISLKRVHFFNMDEYMITPKQTVSPQDTMSFHYRMNKEFYERVSSDLIMPENQRHFPEPGREAEYDAAIADLGGVDLCLGGLGINGHVAFNEPPEADEMMSPDDFAGLGTRVLPVSRETKTINAYGYQRGDLQGMPRWCITIGMKQIINARKIYIALNRPWQHGPLKHALFDEEQGFCPATLLRRNKTLTYCAPRDVLKGIDIQ